MAAAAALCSVALSTICVFLSVFVYFGWLHGSAVAAELHCFYSVVSLDTSSSSPSGWLRAYVAVQQSRIEKEIIQHLPKHLTREICHI